MISILVLPVIMSKHNEMNINVALIAITQLDPIEHYTPFVKYLEYTSILWNKKSHCL